MNNKITRVHFMGIGGSGASAVAQIAKGFGYEVTGCDLEFGRNTHYLEKAGIKVEIGHSASHLQGVDLLAHTPAVLHQSSTEEEYVSAKKKKIAMTWEDFMARELMKGKVAVGVAGTHGKGHTTAMIGRILEIAGKDPTVEVGANLLDWERRNFRIGQGEHFVFEADEYDDNFLVYNPNLLVVTSIEMDHPDFFKSMEQMIGSFAKLVARLREPKILVLNKNDKGCVELAKVIGKIGGIEVIWANGGYGGKLQLPGEHIRKDAQLAAVAAKALGVNESDIKKGLEGFGGLERRFEYKGETEEGAKVYDDYAHHPTAVAANIKAVRELFPKRKIWVVLEPHMHSRLQALFTEFVKALKLADRAIVTNVYTRRELDVTKPTGKELAIAIGEPKATYVGGDEVSIANFVKRNSKKGDVIVVMGAGESYKIAEQLVN